MIRYCCWFCKKHGDCIGCYNAAGGEEHFKWAILNVCKIEDKTCKEDFPFDKVPMSECWEPIEG